MRKEIKFLKFAIVFVIFWMAIADCIHAQKLSYFFQDNFNEADSLAPAVIPISTGSFQSDVLDELSCVPRQAYHFDLDNGVQFDNNTAGNFLGESYSIELYFKFDNASGYCKIIDLKTPFSDYGLYCTGTVLEFYPVLQIASSAFSNGRYVHLVMTRDSASQEVNLYIDGVLSGSFTDGSGYAAFDEDNLLSFFVDDANEESAGNIAMLRLYNYPLPEAEVGALYDNLHADLTPVTFSVNDRSQCLDVNAFTFTNTIQDTTSVYTYLWNFGDGDSSSTPIASHTYAEPGNYTVTLQVTSFFCVDSSFMEVTVHPNPQIDLGPDSAICFGGSLILNAGVGYVYYAWSDNTYDFFTPANTSGIYSVLVRDHNGCEGTDTIDVKVNALPVVNLGSDTLICSGSLLILDAGAGFDTYLWNDSLNGQQFPVSEAGTYMVTVRDSNTCTNSDEIVVTIADLPEISLGNDTSFCAGNLLVLDPGAGYVSYFWNDSTVNQTHAAGSSGSYIVTVTDGNACSSSSSIFVTVNPLPLVSLGNDTSICSAGFYIVDAGPGFVSYLWNDSSVSQSLFISESGAYSVSVTDANTCSSTDEITVTFALQPDIFLGNDTIICPGNLFVLDAGSGFISYLWNDSSTNQTLGLISPGTYTVIVTDSNACTNSADITIAVLPLPAVGLGNDTSICSGSLLLLDAGTGFASYQWNDSTVNQTLSVGAAGTYTVIVTDNNSCTNSDYVHVDVSPLPIVNLGNDSSFCQGNMLMLDAGSGFIAYLWNDNSINQFLSVSASGNYSVAVTDSAGCTNGDSIQIVVNPLPLAPVISQQGDSLVSGSLSGNQWYNSNGIIAGATNQYYQPPLSGNYFVIFTDANGCSSDTSNVVYYSPVGIITLASINFAVYPNPASGMIKLLWMGEEGAVKISIINLLGELITGSIYSGPSNNFTMDISQVDPGLYTLKLETKSGTGYRKLIVKR